MFCTKTKRSVVKSKKIKDYGGGGMIVQELFSFFLVLRCQRWDEYFFFQVYRFTIIKTFLVFEG